MENFTWHDGKTFEFWTKTGEVLSTNKVSETHVSSSGGGGHVDPQYGGHVAAAQVSSTVTINHEFWIKEEDGTERAVQLYDNDIPLKVGQKITLIAGKLLGAEKGYYVVLYNHNAKKHWIISDATRLYNHIFPKTHLYELDLILWLFNIKIIAYVIVPLLVWYYINGYVALAIFAWGIYSTFSKLMKDSKSANALDAQLEKMAKEIAQANQA
ncbi:hypothetical protein [Methylotenera sp.]|uniref:hypothetical protein n=1 Tax=Methylotenera sp. TaxID=2051956 RepID=UPI00248A583C|nr:hypothetical protein [Methylotenera sp.]MDI1299550.1 hypothetical protein [Methylotenera sp.]